jgi:putative glutamine amidotransferase
MTGPLVGVTAWRRKLNTFYGPDHLHTLATFYADSLIDAGMTPVVFPGGQSPEAADRLIGAVDGLLLSGGDDVDPSTYGAEDAGSKGTSPEVDQFEVALIRAAREQGKPVLGICRGLQILNVAMGGTLAQEITGEGEVHEPFISGTDPSIWEARRHLVRFEADSIVASAYRSEEAKVNTLHHQGIGELAPELIVEAVAEDGLIEAARCEGDWWALGVQWHPERLDGEHRTLFQVFKDAIQESMASTA